MTVCTSQDIAGREVFGHRSASGGQSHHGMLWLMKLTIELDHEVDGRWIAEVPELNVLLYGDTKQDAIQRAESAAREIVLDRIAHGELPPDSANAVFDIAA
jgi:predicted RNase H-like HicB family nuclease